MRTPMRAATLVVLALLAACELPVVCPADAPPPATTPAEPRGDARYLAYAHAHNDYAHTQPLDEALALGFTSVEADVFFRDGEVRVGHEADALVGTLRALYLDPLRERIATMGGSVYGDGAPFTLWIDLKEDRAALRDGLSALLDAQPGLTRFDAEGEHDGAITVVLTGDPDAKRTLTSRDVRPFARDDNTFRLADLPRTAADAHVAYALEWSHWIGNGSRTEQQQRMACVVGKAHADGRLVRFFHAPDRVDEWTAQLEQGVDFVGADALAALAAYLTSR